MCDMLDLDDDPLVRMMLVEALRDEGLDVIGAGAETGGEGDFRQHGGAGHSDVSLSGRQFGFGAGDVRAPAQQVAGHATGDVRPLQLFE